MRSLLDKDFHYVSSHETRITDTFDRLCPGWRPKKAAPQDDSESVASSKVAQGATPAVAAPFKKAAPQVPARSDGLGTSDPIPERSGPAAYAPIPIKRARK